jgi:hypothetical protein
MIIIRLLKLSYEEDTYEEGEAMPTLVIFTFIITVPSIPC